MTEADEYHCSLHGGVISRVLHVPGCQALGDASKWMLLGKMARRSERLCGCWGWLQFARVGLLVFTCSLCCACQALGDTYKWMLYGDDDTLFFVDAVLDLLQPFDPELPYAISDNIWFEANSALVRGCS